MFDKKKPHLFKLKEEALERHRVDSNHYGSSCGTLSIQFDHNAIFNDNKGGNFLTVNKIERMYFNELIASLSKPFQHHH